MQLASYLVLTAAHFCFAAGVHDAHHAKSSSADFKGSHLQLTETSSGDRQLDDGHEITNNSDDVVGILPIDPFQIQVYTQNEIALGVEQARSAIHAIETLLLDNFTLRSLPDTLSLISNITLRFDEDVDLEYATRRRLLRNGRYLEGATRAYSVLKTSGGIAGYNWGIDLEGDPAQYNAPNENNLNAAILAILKSSKFLEDFQLIIPNINEIEIESYSPTVVNANPSQEIDVNDTLPGHIGSTTPVALIACSISAVVIALFGIALYVRKSGSSQTIGKKFVAAKSALRTRSFKHRNLIEDSEYLVEVCTDSTMDDKPISNIASTPNEQSLRIMSMPNPSSVKGQRHRFEETRTIDPSDYVVEIGTE